MAHLFQLCPRCKEEFDAFQEEVESRGGAVSGYRVESLGESAASYGQAFEGGLARAEAHAGRVEAERHQAALAFEDLLRMPPGLVLEQVREAPEIFRGPALAQLLLQECLRRLPGHPKEAGALALVAKTVLRHGPSSGIATELYARATAHLGNAYRALGNLPEAAEAIADARFLLRDAGGGDRLVQAEVDTFEGSLLRAQRRIPEAAALLDRALTVYRLEGRLNDAAVTLLKLGSVCREQGDFEGALARTREALSVLDVAEEPGLSLYARHNLAHFLCDAGDYTAAYEVLAQAASLYEHYSDPLTRLRLLSLEGQLARATGDPEPRYPHQVWKRLEAA